MKLVVVRGTEVIAEVKGWEGPVPDEGHYIVRGKPDSIPPDPGDLMRVRSVTWVILDQPAMNSLSGGHADPLVVVTVL